MKFEELKNRAEQELKELLAEQRASLHALLVKARTRELKHVHKIAAVKETIARILTALASRRSVAEKPAA